AAVRTVVDGERLTVSVSAVERTWNQLGSPVRTAVIWWTPAARFATVIVATPAVGGADPRTVVPSRNWMGPVGPETPAGAAGASRAVNVMGAPTVVVEAEEVSVTMAVSRSTCWPKTVARLQ